MQAGPPRLKPMGLSDLLDTMFRIYRNHFLTFIGIVAIIQIPLIVLQMGFTMFFNQGMSGDLISLQQDLLSFDPRSDAWSDLPLANLGFYFLVSLLLGFVEIIIAQKLISGALTNAISRCYFKQPVSIPGAYDSLGTNRMITLIVAGLLVAILMITASLIVITILGLMVALVAAIATSQGGGEAGIVLVSMVGIFAFLAAFGIILLIIGTVAILFLFVTQAVVLEGLSPIAAMRRSMQLVRSSFWRIFGTVSVTYLMVQIIMLIPSWAMGMGIGLIFPDPIQDFGVRQSLTTVVTQVINILVLPPLIITYTLLYYDVRIRKEGFDLQQLRS